jgi:hypothetical protein
VVLGFCVRSLITTDKVTDSSGPGLGGHACSQWLGSDQVMIINWIYASTVATTIIQRRERKLLGIELHSIDIY